MTRYQKNNAVVDAYQHQPDPGNDTAAYPQWLIALIVTEQIRPMPDGSIHVTPADGSVLPLPIGYWLIRDVTDDENSATLYVIAPDVFAAQYAEV